MKIFKRILFYIASFTWGLPMSLIGLVVIGFLAPFKRVHVYHGRLYGEVGTNWGGLELGCFFICDRNSSNLLKNHECGHGLQNCLWGPLMPFVISIPSAIRYWYREILSRVDFQKYKQLPDYDAIWFEGQATRWGSDFVATDKW